MGTDDVAASLFNVLGEETIHDPDQMYLLCLHRKVKNYYSRLITNTKLDKFEIISTVHGLFCHSWQLSFHSSS